MRVSGVDGLRGGACLLVAVGHAWFLGGMAHLEEGHPLTALVASSWIGVDVFFVLSAVVLLAPHAAGAAFPPARVFYQRRVARIVPLYVVALAVALLLAGWLQPGVPRPPSAEGWGLVAAHLTFTANPFLADRVAGIGFGTETVVWTLGVEAGFYLLLPLLGRWWVRHPYLGLVLGLGVAQAWAGLVHAAPAGIQQRLLLETPSYAGHFAVGMTLAVLLFSPNHRALADVARPLSGPLKAVGLGWVLAFMVLNGSQGLAGEGGQVSHVLGTVPALPGIALLVAGAALAPSRLLDGKVARYLADTSYATYLMHLMVLEVAVKLGLQGPGENLPFVLLLVGPVAGTVLLAGVVHRRFEVPARAWVNSLGRRDPALVPAAVPA